jgi:hypothetical protein
MLHYSSLTLIIGFVVTRTARSKLYNMRKPSKHETSTFTSITKSFSAGISFKVLVHPTSESPNLAGEIVR